MQVESFVDKLGVEFFAGVPDSQLKALCDYLMSRYGVDGKHHIIAANEGNCTAIAAGYHLATGKVPVVYMQNSGEGNAVNPIASLCNDKVYGIPVIFVVGWRGEPGVHDEPQHAYQGEVTLKLLEDMDIATCIIGMDTTKEDIGATMMSFGQLLAEGKQVAFIVRKDALIFNGNVKYSNQHCLLREEIIKNIVAVTCEDVIVSTTGKASRELFEIRESRRQPHNKDFLTVGSMGHSSSIALGIALQMTEKKIWIIDGDGSMIMHLGSMAVIGAYSPRNLVHVIINNGAHESVGGQPTVVGSVNIVKIALGCGYPKAVCVDNLEDLDKELRAAKARSNLSLIEVKCAVGARTDLGRPTTTAKVNKEIFMGYLSQ